METKQTEKPTFNPNDWEKVIATEDGEVGCCDNCRTISAPAKKGEHIYCENCKKFLWRKLPGK